MQPIICLGQQPNGILPKRFFIAKLRTARKLQEEIGGKIVWFCHDSDPDSQETRTRIPSDQHPDGFVETNFSFVNKTQRKFTPLAHKSVGDLSKIQQTLLHHTNDFVLEAFDAVQAKTVAEFCIQMYQNLGLLEKITIVRSSDPSFRTQAQTPDLSTGWFYDVTHKNELVRARLEDEQLRLHRGGGVYDELGSVQEIRKEYLSAGWKKRFEWMQSVIGATHYVLGKSEQEYFQNIAIKNPPEFVLREDIKDSGLAFIPKESQN